LLSFLNHGWRCDPETSTYVHIFQLQVRFTRLNPNFTNAGSMALFLPTTFKQLDFYVFFTELWYRYMSESNNYHGGTLTR
jgi:hypothetical protein